MNEDRGKKRKRRRAGRRWMKFFLLLVILLLILKYCGVTEKIEEKVAQNDVVKQIEEAFWDSELIKKLQNEWSEIRHTENWKKGNFGFGL